MAVIDLNRGGDGPPRRIRIPTPGLLGFGGVVIAILLVIIAFTTSYTIPSDSIGLVQRFGKHVKEVNSGLHFKLPMGIDSVIVVPVKRQLKQEFGFSTRGSTNPAQSRPDMAKQSQMVSGDLNAALVEWVLQYRISDPRKYMFEVRYPGETLRDVSETVMRAVVGDRTVDEVLTIGRQEIEDESLLKMRELATKYEIGVSIDQVQLKNINPPRPVQESFNEVNQAQQEKERLINEARRDYNKVIPLAEGEKDQKIREAEGYAQKRVNEADGDASRFNAVFEEYLKAPEVTRRRIYIETLKEVLPAVETKIIVDESAKQILPLMHLNQLGGVTK